MTRRRWAAVAVVALLFAANRAASWPDAEAPPEPVDVAEALPRAATSTIAEESRDLSTTPRHTTTTTAPTTTLPVPTTPAPTTTAPPPPTTAEANDVAADHVWVDVGETRATSSTVYCLNGTTYSGGQTQPGGGGVGRTVAVNRDNGEWERYRGTTWRVVDGPHAGAIYTVQDAGTRAHFDMWHGDRADCRDYALGSYGVQHITVQQVELRPA